MVIPDSVSYSNHNRTEGCGADTACSLVDITAFLDATYYGNSKLTVFNSTMARWQFIHGLDGAIGDELYIVKSK